MDTRLTRLLGVCVVLCLIVGLALVSAPRVEAYYGGYGGYSSLLGGLYGGYGGLLGGYGGLMGGLYGGYGGLLGGYGGYGGLLGGYGGLMGGLYGGYGGLYGGSSLYSPFGYQNLYYPVQTTGGLTYQVPFLQIAPLLGVAGLYNQLFPGLFNPQPQLPPIVNVSTPSSYNVTFPTPVGVYSIT
ncbi:MAG: hypothetical protein ACMUIL_14390 [bacterium]